MAMGPQGTCEESSRGPKYLATQHAVGVSPNVCSHILKFSMEATLASVGNLCLRLFGGS